MTRWYIIKMYLQQSSLITIGTCITLMLTIMFYSYVHFFLGTWFFLAGFSVTYKILRPGVFLPCLLIQRKVKKNLATEDEETSIKAICRVCGKSNCPRHKIQLDIQVCHPWTKLKVSKDVDDAVTELINLVLKEYVYKWYRDFSQNEEFVDELRINIRFLMSVFIYRFKKVDVPRMVTQRITKAVVCHIDAVLQASNQSIPPGSDLQQCSLECFGSNVHCALWSRIAELEYLRRLSERIIPFILQQHLLNSRFSSCSCSIIGEILSGSLLLPTMDAIADPDFVNSLLIVFFDKSLPPSLTEPPSETVEFMCRFAASQAYNQSCLRFEMNEMLSANCPQHLYAFIQFLKTEAAVNVLQFCLSCDEFHKRILCPDVSQSELVILHTLAKQLYINYIAPDAHDKIKFEKDVVAEIRDVVKGPPEDVVRLRMSSSLFKAYEHAYNLLEYTLLPLFHQSDDYYSMICGNRPIYSGSRLPVKSSKKKDLTFSNIGSKFIDMFRSTPDEQASSGELESLQLLLSPMEQEDEYPPPDIVIPRHGDSVTWPDLSSWRVAIPRVMARFDVGSPGRRCFVYIVDVRRLDVQQGSSSNWTVARRYPEFYTLERKLVEFHGELQELQLPAKKTFGTKSEKFPDSARNIFQEYLQKLLTLPMLRRSELLYNFLTSEEEFSTSFIPDINLGKLVKSVPMKLVKEKGQHLEPFLITFEKSTEATKPKPRKHTRRGSDMSIISSSSEKLTNGLFENNMNSGFAPPHKGDVSSVPAADILTVSGLCDSIMYLAREVYKVPAWVHHMLVSMAILFKNTLDTYSEIYLANKLSEVTQDHRITSLVHLIKALDHCNTYLSMEQKRKRYEEALNGAVDFFPGFISSLIGSRKVLESTKFLIDVFQMPKLNKQLSYVLLDIVLEEVFPELQDAQSPSASP